MERMKQTVIQMNTIRLIHFGEPTEDRRSLIAPSKRDEPHRQNTIIDEENVWVIGDSMFHKGRYVNTRDLCGQNVAKPRHTGVSTPAVALA
jgi:hypothetical protein